MTMELKKRKTAMEVKKRKIAMEVKKKTAKEVKKGGRECYANQKET